MSTLASVALASMWSMFGIVFVLTALRLYTRFFVNRSPGYDDYAFALSTVLLLGYTIFVHVGTLYGYGEDFSELDPDDGAEAIKFVMIGQTFSFVGMAMAKTAMGLFLLRIVTVRWHQMAIGAAFVALAGASSISVIIFWSRCTPTAAIYDPRVTGSCFVTNIVPYGILLGATCAFVDFFFAIFPWLFIWKLNMTKKEKVTIASSMSLGIAAGVCGILRTIEVQGLDEGNYTKLTVPLIIWSSGEIAITMICTAIPTLIPLFRLFFPSLLSASSKGSYKRQQGSGGQPHNGDQFYLETIGGHKIPRTNIPKSDHAGFSEAPAKLGINGPTTKVRIRGDNSSEEDILGSETTRARRPEGKGIYIRREVDVERFDHRVHEL